VDDVTASFVVDRTGASSAPKKGRRSKSSKRKISSRTRQALERDAGAEGAADAESENPDPLVAEILASQEGHLSVTLEIERGEYEKLHEIAERNGLSVPAFIREVLSQYTRFK
jgi:hypothetical protein